jgi:hypothetical protein
MSRAAGAASAAHIEAVGPIVDKDGRGEKLGHAGNLNDGHRNTSLRIQVSTSADKQHTHHLESVKMFGISNMIQFPQLIL